MPPGHLTFASDESNQDLLSKLLTRFPEAVVTDTDPDVLLTSSVPGRPARHIVLTGPLTGAIDQWDLSVPPQTVAGVVWISPDQDALDAATAWLLLRTQTPATPLSDLTDDNDRALRWSVVGARAICFPSAQEVEVDEQSAREWADQQPQVQALGQAVERIGGQSAEAVLDSLERFQNAMLALDELAPLPPPEPGRRLADAVASQLQQVQRSGLSRWRSGKARVQADQNTKEAARELAGQRLSTLIEVHSQEVAREQWAQRNREVAEEIHDSVAATVDELELPVAVDFAESPRTWSDAAPPPRRYVLVSADQVDHLENLEDIEEVSVRPSPDVLPDTAICAILQSGFSLPALR